MFCLTHQERKTLLLIAGLILVGSVLKFFNAAGINKKLDRNSEVVIASETNQIKILININQANQAELGLLPGIGPVTAKRIIEYRSQYGTFESLEDLKKVKGIGDKKAQSLAGRISF